MLDKLFRNLALLGISLALVSAANACADNSTVKSLEFQVTGRNKDAVLSLYLMPKNGKGEIIAHGGAIDVELWDKPSVDAIAKGQQIGQWDNIDLANSDFITGKGFLLNLEPNDDFTGVSGHQAYLRIDLSADKTNVSITGIVITGDLPPCCTAKR